MTHWQALDREIRRWQEARLPVRLWLRDDDAIEPTPALDRLDGLCCRHQVPYCLAVIPAGLQAGLGDWARGRKLCRSAVHGFSHINHAATGEKKCELGLHRPLATVLEELATGRDKVRDITGDRFFNCLVPPWNRIDPVIADRLGDIGFDCLSAFGWRPSAPHLRGVRQANAHIDIIDWQGTRGGKSDGELVDDLIGALAKARTRGGVAIGVLTHHLVHDARAWSFLEALLEHTAHRHNISWCAIDEIV